MTNSIRGRGDRDAARLTALFTEARQEEWSTFTAAEAGDRLKACAAKLEDHTERVFRVVHGQAP